MTTAYLRLESGLSESFIDNSALNLMSVVSFEVLCEKPSAYV